MENTVTITFNECDFNTVRDIIENYSFNNTDTIKKYTDIATKYILDPNYINEKVTLEQCENIISTHMCITDKLIPVFEVLRHATITR